MDFNATNTNDDMALDSCNPLPLFSRLGEFVLGYARLEQRIEEWIEGLGRTVVATLEQLRREMEQPPLDPYGDPVPDWNVPFYWLAEAAYAGGDYEYIALFLDEIEAEDSADNVILIRKLLKPTFDPERLDRRVDWERMDPAAARSWLRERLEDLKLSAWKKEQGRKNSEQSYEVDRIIVNASPSNAPELEFVEFELREDERALYEQLQSVLPEQQFLVCWYRAQGIKYKEIAARMNIALGTVKSHARVLKQNPRFREALGR
jgi:hypothetical protein